MRIPSLFIGALVVVGLAACSDDSSGGGGGSCASVCNCVVSTAGEAARADCMNECNAALGSSNPVAECKSRLAAHQITTCDSTCNAFGQAPATGGVLCRDKNSSTPDSDCVALGKPKKLDCGNATEMQSALNAGCSPEHADDPSDNDVCCPTTVNGIPDTSSSGGTATNTDFCNKCAQCVPDTSFDEGFCTPFRAGLGFDTAACIAGGSSAELAMPTVTASTVSGWTCADFDSNE